MAALRVRRTWWISQRPTPEVSLFCCRRGVAADRECCAVPFQLALPPRNAAAEPRLFGRNAWSIYDAATTISARIQS
jgi:hypothetical protein